jgi:hypothetical protein
MWLVALRSYVTKLCLIDLLLPTSVTRLHTGRASPCWILGERNRSDQALTVMAVSQITWPLQAPYLTCQRHLVHRQYLYNFAFLPR